MLLTNETFSWEQDKANDLNLKNEVALPAQTIGSIREYLPSMVLQGEAMRLVYKGIVKASLLREMG